MEPLEAIKTELEKIVNEEAPFDGENFSVCDSSEGDLDNAFEFGTKAGRLGLALELLKLCPSA